MGVRGPWQCCNLETTDDNALLLQRWEWTPLFPATQPQRPHPHFLLGAQNGASTQSGPKKYPLNKVTFLDSVLFTESTSVSTAPW